MTKCLNSLRANWDEYAQNWLLSHPMEYRLRAPICITIVQISYTLFPWHQIQMEQTVRSIMQSANKWEHTFPNSFSN